MNAVGDAYTPRVIAARATFLGKNMFLGDLLQLVDNNGSLITEHYVTNQNEDLALLDTGLRSFMNGVKVTSLPVGGEVLIYLE